MKLKEGFIIRSVAGKKVAVATGELAKQFKGMITLNETADLIFGMLNEGVSDISEITAEITKAYEIDSKTAENDVRKTVERLTELGLISEN